MSYCSCGFPGNRSLFDVGKVLYTYIFDAKMGDKARSEALADGKWRRELERGGKVDAMDGDDMWYEAVVIGTTPKNISIRFLGWSEKWNASFLRSSKRIAPRNSKVPNWRLTLRPGKCVEVSSDSNTWCSSVCSVVDFDQKRFQIIRSPGCTTEWFGFDSPLLAEPYTHCGYKVEADSKERRRMLTARRVLFEEELRKLAVEKENKALATVGNDLKAMINNPELSDVQFEIEGEVVYAHRMMLVSRSPYFRSMLLGNMAESKKGKIEIPNISHAVFLAIMTFVYTGQIEFNHENAFELLEASEIFCLASLKDQLCQYLKNSITEETAVEILIVSKTFSLTSLSEKCIAFAIDNYNTFIEKDAFLPLESHSSLLLEILRRINNPQRKNCTAVCEQKESNNGKKNDGSEFLNRVQKKLNESSLSADAPEAGSAAATDPNSSRTRINSH